MSFGDIAQTGINVLQQIAQNLGSQSQLGQQMAAHAAQQQQLAESKRQFDAEMELRNKQSDQAHQQWQTGTLLDLLKSGGEPVNSDNTVNRTMSAPTPLPSAPPPGGGNILTPSAEAPTPGMVSAPPNLSVTPGAPVQGAAPATEQPTRVPVNPQQVLSVGGRGYRVPTPQESQDDDLSAALKKQAALHDALAIPNPFGSLNVDPHHKFTPDELNKLSEADDRLSPKTKDPHFVTATNSITGDVTTTAFDPDSGKQLWQSVNKGAGKQHAPASDVQKPATRGQFLRVEQTKARAIQDAQKQLSKDAAAARADPLDPQGEANQALEDHFSRLQQIQNDYEDQISDLTGGTVKHDSWADQWAAKAQQRNAAGRQPSATASVAPRARGAAMSSYQPGQAVKLKNGQTVTIKKIRGDGTFEY